MFVHHLVKFRYDVLDLSQSYMFCFILAFEDLLYCQALKWTVIFIFCSQNFYVYAQTLETGGF